MSVVGVLGALLALANAIAEYLRDRQLLEAGEATAALKSIAEGQAVVRRALAARRAVKHDPDSVRSDADNRD